MEDLQLVEKLSEREMSLHQIRKLERETSSIQKEICSKLKIEEELNQELKLVNKRVESQKEELESANETYSRLRQKVIKNFFCAGSFLSSYINIYIRSNMKIFYQYMLTLSFANQNLFCPL